MKKLQNISNQIKNNTFSYTGKGAFEAVVNNFKSEIINWLENLIPLQQQIQYLQDKADIQFQKRNYTRILTKLLPDEYNEFVSLNILVRDSNIIAKHYQNEFDLTLLYAQLLDDKYLKYPGKYEKYVEFEIFQKFVMMYRDELNGSLDTDEMDHEQPKSIKIEEKQTEETKVEQKVHKNVPKPKTKKETNWTNLLLGR
ncbi:MAG: hypothetical protein KAQ94_04320 [Arcobacteraceae bacterium]|nr:hypothetical protein [Arcobacteraceae bacterium]